MVSTSPTLTRLQVAAIDLQYQNIGAAPTELTRDVLREIDDAASTITAGGARRSTCSG